MKYLQQIKFNYEKPSYCFKHVTIIKKWIHQTIKSENCELAFLNVVICSDDFLLPLNKKYLNHDTLTDIITFPFESEPIINGVIYISIERVRENAKIYHQTISNELHRIIIHGVLHLCGYGDKTKSQKQEMTKLEDKYLNKLAKMFHVKQK